MKTNIQYFGAMALAVALIPGLTGAQGEPRDITTNATGSFQSDSGRTSAVDRIGPVMRSTKIIGAEVRNSANEKIGKINDMVVDIESGKIVDVVMAVGGFLGVGDKQVTLSPASFSADEDGLVFSNVDKSTLKDAPQFDAEKMSDEPKLERGYQDKSETPSFKRADRGSFFVPPSARKESTMLATKLVGFPIKNNEGDNIGKVDNLTVDLPAGRVVQVVVAASGYLGTKDELNFVPPTSLRFNPVRDALILNMSRELLSGAPRFKSSEWPDVSDRYGSSEIYRYYQVEPYFRTNGAPVRPAEVIQYEQGDNADDKALQSNVETAIRQSQDISVNARNVKVITRDGRLTLRGSVDNETDREKLAGIAYRHVKEGDFESQLKVQNTSANR